MPFDAFLKLDGVPGESMDSKHKNEIDVLSFSFGVTQTPGPSGAHGKANVQDLSIVKNIDAASPKLFVTACSGQTLKQAVLTVRNPTTALDYLTITLSTVLVTNVAPAGSAGGASDRPMETVSFDFAKIEIQYTSQAANGGPGPKITGICQVLTH